MDPQGFETKIDELIKRSMELKDIVTIKAVNGLIEEARALLGSNKTDEAEKKYNEAAATLDTAVLSSASEGLARQLLWIEFGYLAFLLLLAYLAYKIPNAPPWRGLAKSLQIQTAWFGGLGGVTVGLFGIYSHIKERDFDPKFKLWYICKPVMGAIFGWFVFLAYYVTLLSVQGSQSNGIENRTLPFAIAFLAGFSERFTIKMIDRLMSVLTTWDEQSAAVSGEKSRSK